MARVRFSGAIPPTIAENARVGDWAATLALTGDLAALRAVELVGPAALHFALRWDPALGVVFLEPGAATDYEALADDPTLVFGLRYTYADGTTEIDAETLAVTVLDRDDTPPQALRFGSGGTIRADQFGGAIGTLAVDDPDTAGPFGFRVLGWDDWRFAFDGATLRLQDGVNLGLDAIPRATLIVEVSDGRQAAAFLLDITVLEDTPGTHPILQPNAPQHGIVALGDGRAVVTLDAAAVVAATEAANGARLIVQPDAPALLLPAATSFALPEGRLEFGADSDAARAARLHHVLRGEAPDGAELAALVAQRDDGAAWTTLAAGLLADRPAQSDAAFLAGVTEAALGRAPTTAETARTAALGRAQTAVDVALGAEAAAYAPPPEDGTWVPLPLGLNEAPAWLADRGGIGGPPVTPAPIDVLFL